MHLTPAFRLLLLIATFSTASLFSSPQQPPALQRAPIPPRQTCLQPFFSKAYARCPRGYHWVCSFYGRPGRHRPIHCHCVPLHSAARGLTAAAAAQNVSTLEVVAEIEPGNNRTRASVFDLRCDAGRQHVACAQAECGFACGCYDDWDADAAEEEGGAVGDSYEEESATKSEVEAPYSDDFSFQLYRLPFCPVGYHLICCFRNCRRVCYCAPLWSYCPAEPPEQREVAEL